MSFIVDLPPAVEASLNERAQAEGKPLHDFVRDALETLVTPKEFDLKAFLALPREEQDRQLEEQAEAAAPMYAGRPRPAVHERGVDRFHGAG